MHRLKHLLNILLRPRNLRQLPTTAQHQTTAFSNLQDQAKTAATESNRQHIAGDIRSSNILDIILYRIKSSY